jgi:hypothetical protein
VGVNLELATLSFSGVTIMFTGNSGATNIRHLCTLRIEGIRGSCGHAEEVIINFQRCNSWWRANLPEHEGDTDPQK